MFILFKCHFNRELRLDLFKKDDIIQSYHVGIVTKQTYQIRLITNVQLIKNLFSLNN